MYTRRVGIIITNAYLVFERLLKVWLSSAAHDTRLAFVKPLVTISQVALYVRIRYFTVDAVYTSRVGYLTTVNIFM